MLKKIKMWIFGKVIGSKVLGKLVKHAAGGVTGLLFGGKLAPHVVPVFEAMGLNQGQVEAGLVVAFAGIFGAAWNYIEHRFVK